MMLARVPSAMLARAPEQTQKIKQAYQRLAAQHEWPALAEYAELPDARGVILRGEPSVAGRVPR